MPKHKVSRYLSIFGITILVAAMLGMISPTVAGADPGWPQAVDSNVCMVESTPSGGVLLNHTNGKYTLLSSTGVVVTTTDTGLDGACDTSTPQYAVTDDGTIIATGMNSSNKKRVVAYKNGALLWQNTLVDLCSNQVSSFSSNRVNVGADGNVTLRLNSSCSANREMMSIDPSDGSINWQVAVQAWADPMGPSPYSSGVVYRANNNKFVYLTNAGTVDTGKTFTIPSGVYVYDYHTVGKDGNLAVQIDDNSGVYGTSGKSYMYFRNADGTETLREVPAWTQDNRLRMMPNGDVLVTSPSHCSYGAAAEIVHRTGDTVSSCLYNPWPAGSFSTTNSFEKVDANGNVYVVGMYHRTIHSTEQGHTLISMFGPSGHLRNVFSTEAIDQDATFWMGDANLGLYDDTMYAVFGDYWSTGSDKTIYQIALDSAGMDYPRGEILGHSDPRLQYVAMGDSFSSGEGNPPFLSGTDNGGVNECHRSDAAYPRLLDDDINLNLNLVDFVACSGATTDTVLNGGSSTGAWGEPPQVDALTSSTDVVTITVGGNDVGFADYAESCHAADCSPSSQSYADIMDAIEDPDFYDNLYDTYMEILMRAPNAEVYVLDYPYIAEQNAGTCGLVDLSGAWYVQEALDNVISLAVDELVTMESQTRLHYVDTNYTGSPFEGQHICNGGDSDFNTFTYPETEYSYHPNQSGHEHYAEIAEDVIG